MLDFREFEFALKKHMPLILLRKNGERTHIHYGTKKYSDLLSSSSEKRRAYFYTRYIALDLSLPVYTELHKKDEYGNEQSFQEFSRKTLRFYSSVERLKSSLRSRGAL